MEHPTLVWAVADSRRRGSPQRVRSGVAALLEGDSRCELASGWRAVDSHDPRHGHINPFITAVVERYSANIVRRDPEQLHDCVKQLAAEVKRELGEQAAARTKRPPQERAGASAHPPVAVPPLDRRAQQSLRAMLRIGTTDGQDGSFRLFVAACRAVEYDLDDATAVATIEQYAGQRPFPRQWTATEILQRVRDAERKCQRGRAYQRDENNLVPLGERDPATGKLVLSPKRTLPTADAFVRDFHLHPGGRTLHAQSDILLRWNGSCYRELEPGGAEHRLFGWLDQALRYVRDRDSGEMTLVPFDANPTTVRAALESVRAYVHLPSTVLSPAWLDGRSDPPPSDLLVGKSKVIHLPTSQQLEATPRLFVTHALDFDPDSNAAEPIHWHRFLHQLFQGDLESLQLLQEWFGYLLTADTAQQKMLLMVGPRRSGKGTLARVLTQLIGADNVCGPTNSSLTGTFGLQPLIGKSLAIVSDARFAGDGMTTVVERLLVISGEDAVSIDRKYLTSVTMKLPTRFMLLTNEFPRLSDASGALAGRFVILRLTESSYGREDTGLTARLLEELPGILNWAIEGWRQLRERGHFVMPSSVGDVVREIEDLSSPVAAFVRERCHVGSGHRVDVDALFRDWVRWCCRQGRSHAGSKQSFGRNLAAAVTGVRRKRGTNQQPFYSGIALK